MIQHLFILLLDVILSGLKLYSILNTVKLK